MNPRVPPVLAPLTGTAPSPSPDVAEPRSRRYTPGWSDGLGDRLLVFDNSTASSLELLRFHEDIGVRSEFASALADRVAALSHLRHPSLVTSRSVDRLSDGNSLTLVSPHTAGRRLTEILANARGAVFALELIRQLTPALSILQQQGAGMAHGLLSVDRIIVTREGRLVIVETPLASAIELLRWSAEDVRTRLGLVLPETSAPVSLDPRIDMLHLGVIAVSLVLGRRVPVDDFFARATGLLDECVTVAPETASKFRPWIERALQMGEHPFECAQDAEAALSQLPTSLETYAADTAPHAVLAFRAPATQLSASPVPTTPVPSAAAPVAVTAPAPVSHAPLAEMAPDVDLPEVSGPIDLPVTLATPKIDVVSGAATVPPAVASSVVDMAPEPPAAPMPMPVPAFASTGTNTRPAAVASPTALKAPATPSEAVSARSPATPAPKPAVVSLIAEIPMSSKSELSQSPASLSAPTLAKPRTKAGRSWATMAAAGLAIVAVAEAVVIASMMSQAPAPMAGVTLTVPSPLPAPAVVPAAPAEIAGALAGGADISSSGVAPGPTTSAPAPAASPASVAEPTPAAAPAPGGRFGGVKVTAPIDLQVFENGNFLGTTAGPIALAEGTHALDVANDTLGYRARQNVTVKGGQMATVVVTLPQGKLNVNAAPWANVWIDGAAAGETPLANVALTIGAHEILFRHPQLGEQRLTAVVKADSVARVSASFQR